MKEESHVHLNGHADHHHEHVEGEKAHDHENVQHHDHHHDEKLHATEGHHNHENQAVVVEGEATGNTDINIEKRNDEDAPVAAEGESKKLGQLEDIQKD